MEPITNDDQDQVTGEADQNGANAHAEQEMSTVDMQQVIAERDSYLDQLQRSLADFANYRRRVEQDRVKTVGIATGDLLSSVVPIADDFHRALEAIPADQSEAPWVMGVTLIDRNSPICSNGKVFRTSMRSDSRSIHRSTKR